jgi:hypothetical protein
VHVKIGADTACGIGERSRVRFDQRVRDRDVVILDQGRIRVIGGQAIGRPSLRPVELHTTDGKFDLRSADIEVKTLPKTAETPLAPTLVKLNIGEARLGDLAMTKEGVQGISGGKVLERAIPIGDIAFTPRQTLPTKTGEATTPVVRESYVAIPVTNLAMTEFKPLAEPVKISTAIVSPELAKSSLYMETTALNKTAVATILVKDPTQVFQPKVTPVDSAMLLSSIPFESKTGTLTSLTTLSKELQTAQATGTTSTATTQLLTEKSTLSSSTTLNTISPKLTTNTTTFRLR